MSSSIWFCAALCASVACSISTVGAAVANCSVLAQGGVVNVEKRTHQEYRNCVLAEIPRLVFAPASPANGTVPAHPRTMLTFDNLTVTNCKQGIVFDFLENLEVLIRNSTVHCSSGNVFVAQSQVQNNAAAVRSIRCRMEDSHIVTARGAVLTIRGNITHVQDVDLSVHRSSISVSDGNSNDQVAAIGIQPVSKAIVLQRVGLSSIRSRIDLQCLRCGGVSALGVARWRDPIDVAVTDSAFEHRNSNISISTMYHGVAIGGVAAIPTAEVLVENTAVHALGSRVRVDFAGASAKRVALNGIATSGGKTRVRLSDSSLRMVECTVEILNTAGEVHDVAVNSVAGHNQAITLRNSSLQSWGGTANILFGAYGYNVGINSIMTRYAPIVVENSRIDSYGGDMTMVGDGKAVNTGINSICTWVGTIAFVNSSIHALAGRMWISSVSATVHSYREGIAVNSILSTYPHGAYTITSTNSTIAVHGCYVRLESAYFNIGGVASIATGGKGIVRIRETTTITVCNANVSIVALRQIPPYSGEKGAVASIASKVDANVNVSIMVVNSFVNTMVCFSSAEEASTIFNSPNLRLVMQNVSALCPYNFGGNFSPTTAIVFNVSNITEPSVDIANTSFNGARIERVRDVSTLCDTSIFPFWELSPNLPEEPRRTMSASLSTSISPLARSPTEPVVVASRTSTLVATEVPASSGPTSEVSQAATHLTSAEPVAAVTAAPTTDAPTTTSVDTATSSQEATTNSPRMATAQPSVLEVTRSISLNQTVRTEPPEVKEKEEPRSVALTLLMPKESAEAVVVSSTAVAGASAAFSPTAATHAVRAASVLRSVECHFSKDDVKPSFLEHPIRVSLGSSTLKEYAGSSLVTTLLFVLLPCGANFYVYFHGPRREAQQRKGKNPKREGANTQGARTKPGEEEQETPVPAIIKVQRNGFAIFSGITLVFFVPNVCFASTMILGHRGEADSAAMAVGAFNSLAVLALVWGYFHVVKQQYSSNVVACGKQASPSASSMKDTRIVYGNSPKSTCYYVESFGPMFDATSNAGSTLTRLYYLEEVCVSCLMMIVAGARPYSGSCTVIAGTIIFLSVVHLLYLLYTRPYFSKIESCFAYVQSGLQLILAISATVSVNDPAAMKVIGYGLIFQGAVFFIQAAVMAFWAWTREQRREVLQLHQAEGEGSELGVLAAPILHSGEGSAAAGSNPLLQRYEDDDDEDDTTVTTTTSNSSASRTTDSATTTTTSTNSTNTTTTATSSSSSGDL